MWETVNKFMQRSPPLKCCNKKNILTFYYSLYVEFMIKKGTAECDHDITTIAASKYILRD